jgi:hypothetical protein
MYYILLPEKKDEQRSTTLQIVLLIYTNEHKDKTYTFRQDLLKF